MCGPGGARRSVQQTPSGSGALRSGHRTCRARSVGPFGHDLGMDTYDSLELAREFKPLRKILGLACAVVAIFFNDELVSFIIAISQEHAANILEPFLEELTSAPAPAS